MRSPVPTALLALAIPMLSLCACQPSEAPRVELPVVVDGSGLGAATNDLGWTVELDAARVAIEDLRFTTAGEVHDEREREGSAWVEVSALLVARAWAHPGHYQGGEIIGELPGTHVIDFVADEGRELGVATLIVGEYTATNFGLARAEELADEDPLLGHTALLRGTARRELDGALAEVAFTVLIDSPLDRELIGVPFEASVSEASSFAIGLRMLSVDPFEGDTLFAGVDFGALDEADGELDGRLDIVDPELDPNQSAAASDTYYEIRREFQTHDLFEAVPL